MHTSLEAHTRRRLRGQGRFKTVYLAMILLWFHWTIVMYVNSTFLGQFVSTETVSILYTIGSMLTVFAFLFIAQVLRELGNYHLMVGLAVTETLVLCGLALFADMRIIIPLFVLHHAIAPLLLFNLDIFVESFIGKEEGKTGGRRGLLLTISGIATAGAPLFAGFLLGSDSPRFMFAYLAAAVVMIPFLHIVSKHFRDFSDPPYKDIDIFSGIRTFWRHTELRYVFLAHSLLQLFFTWMIIYMPLYLATEIGFKWNEIGLILFVGLMAYVLLEYPIGEIADRYLGEQEMMAVGFIILATSTAWISFMESAAIVPWMVTLFLTRVGAALVETTTESYFFKHVGGKDAHVVSFFRITRPLSTVLGALLGSFALLYFPIGYMFLVLALFLLPGIAFSLMLEDTR